MSSIIKFAGAVHRDSSKKGVITPDEKGYYTVVVGALNSYNSAGEFYTATDAIELFNHSSQLQRRIKNKALYGELGHPKRQPGQSMEDLYTRMISIEETNICVHFSEIWLDLEYGRNNPHLGAPDLIAILAKVKPTGAKAIAAQTAFDNPEQNLAFSIRALYEPKVVNGRTVKVLTNVVTFDMVTEGGIKIADKMYSPALESLTDGKVNEIGEVLVNKETLKRVLEKSMETVGLESNKDMYSDILSSITKKPQSSRLRGW